MNSLETQGKQPINNTEGRAQGGRENQEHMMGWKGEVSWDKKGICNIIWEQIVLGKDCIRKAREKNVDVSRMDQILCEKEEKVLIMQTKSVKCGCEDWRRDGRTGGKASRVSVGSCEQADWVHQHCHIWRQREVRNGRRMRIIPGQLKKSAESK